MSKYGQTAVQATALVSGGSVQSPTDGWEVAVQRIFPNQEASQKKGCPKNTYLGLCEEGLVKGVPQGDYTRSQDNKRYALEAVQLLRGNSALASDRSLLWKAIMKGENKVENYQMDVVLTLWNEGLIHREKV